jgi:hypothetical protein
MALFPYVENRGRPDSDFLFSLMARRVSVPDGIVGIAPFACNALNRSIFGRDEFFRKKFSRGVAVSRLNVFA